MDEAVSAITEKIVTAVSTETDQDPSELPPLYESIDPETLATACQVFDTGETTFQYAGQEVTVHADRSVENMTVMSRGQQPEHARSD